MDCRASLSSRGCTKATCTQRHRDRDRLEPRHLWYCAEFVATTRCRHGAACNYTHPTPPWMALTDCPDFLSTGTCQFSTDGRACPMRHHQGLRAEVWERRRAPRLCTEWTNPEHYYQCRFGDQCECYHPQNVRMPSAMGRRPASAAGEGGAPMTGPYIVAGAAAATPAADAAPGGDAAPPAWFSDAAAGAGALGGGRRGSGTGEAGLDARLAALPVIGRGAAAPTASVAAAASGAGASSGVPMPAVGGGGGPPLVFTLWDIENTGVPPFDASFSPTDFAEQLNEALVRILALPPGTPIDNEIVAFYNALGLVEYVPTMLAVRHMRAAGIVLQHTGDKPNAADHALKGEVDKIKRRMRQGLRVAGVVFMTSDSDFTDKIRELRFEGVPTVLVRQRQANRTLTATADAVVQWSEIGTRRWLPRDRPRATMVAAPTPPSEPEPTRPAPRGGGPGAPFRPGGGGGGGGGAPAAAPVPAPAVSLSEFPAIARLVNGGHAGSAARATPPPAPAPTATAGGGAGSADSGHRFDRGDFADDEQIAAILRASAVEEEARTAAVRAAEEEQMAAVTAASVAEAPAAAEPPLLAAIFAAASASASAPTAAAGAKGRAAAAAPAAVAAADDDGWGVVPGAAVATPAPAAASRLPPPAPATGAPVSADAVPFVVGAGRTGPTSQSTPAASPLALWFSAAMSAATPPATPPVTSPATSVSVEALFAAARQAGSGATAPPAAQRGRPTLAAPPIAPVTVSLSAQSTASDSFPLAAATAAPVPAPLRGGQARSRRHSRSPPRRGRGRRDPLSEEGDDGRPPQWDMDPSEWARLGFADRYHEAAAAIPLEAGADDAALAPTSASETAVVEGADDEAAMAGEGDRLTEEELREVEALTATIRAGGAPIAPAPAPVVVEVPVTATPAPAEPSSFAAIIAAAASDAAGTAHHDPSAATSVAGDGASRGSGVDSEDDEPGAVEGQGPVAAMSRTSLHAAQDVDVTQPDGGDGAVGADPHVPAAVDPAALSLAGSEARDAAAAVAPMVEAPPTIVPATLSRVQPAPLAPAPHVGSAGLDDDYGDLIHSTAGPSAADVLAAAGMGTSAPPAAVAAPAAVPGVVAGDADAVPDGAALVAGVALLLAAMPPAAATMERLRAQHRAGSAALWQEVLWGGEKTPLGGESQRRVFGVRLPVVGSQV